MGPVSAFSAGGGAGPGEGPLAQEKTGTQSPGLWADVYAELTASGTQRSTRVRARRAGLRNRRTLGPCGAAWPCPSVVTMPVVLCLNPN